MDITRLIWNLNRIEYFQIIPEKNSKFLFFLFISKELCSRFNNLDFLQNREELNTQNKLTIKLIIMAFILHNKYSQIQNKNNKNKSIQITPSSSSLLMN